MREENRKMPANEAVQKQIEAISERMSTVEDKLEILDQELRGTKDDRGVFEIVRITNATATKMSERFDSFTTQFKLERAKLIGMFAGIVAAASTIGTLIGWLLSHGK